MDTQIKILGESNAVFLRCLGGNGASEPPPGDTRLVESELPYNLHPYLNVARKVRVRVGPLPGCEGILIRKKNIARMVLSVHLLSNPSALKWMPTLSRALVEAELAAD